MVNAPPDQNHPATVRAADKRANTTAPRGMTVRWLGEPRRILMRAFRMAADACPRDGMACMAELVTAGEGRRLEQALATERQPGYSRLRRSARAAPLRPGGRPRPVSGPHQDRGA
jgi:hypothetical protein